MDELRMRKQMDGGSDSVSVLSVKNSALPIRGECGLCGVSPLELVLEVSFKVCFLFTFLLSYFLTFFLTFLNLNIVD